MISRSLSFGRISFCFPNVQLFPTISLRSSSLYFQTMEIALIFRVIKLIEKQPSGISPWLYFGKNQEPLGQKWYSPRIRDFHPSYCIILDSVKYSIFVLVSEFSDKIMTLIFVALIAFANGLINAKRWKRPTRFYVRLTETKNGPLKCSGTLIDYESILTGRILTIQ